MLEPHSLILTKKEKKEITPKSINGGKEDGAGKAGLGKHNAESTVEEATLLYHFVGVVYFFSLSKAI